jgi:hypothetical protein
MPSRCKHSWSPTLLGKRAHDAGDLGQQPREQESPVPTPHAAGTTYSRDVTLFETGEKPIPAETLKSLGEAGIRRAGRPVRVDCSADATRIIDTAGAATDLDVLYPALGCHVRSQLATAIGAVAPPRET